MSKFSQSCFLHNKRQPNILIRYYLAFLLVITGSFVFAFSMINSQKVEAELNPLIQESNLSEELIDSGMVIIQGNSVSVFSNYPFPENDFSEKVVRKERRIITAYSSTVDQTNNQPFITASGAWVRDGIVAANFLPFGTRIRIPEVFGDKIFVVKDRMHVKNNHKVDVWFPSRQEALAFGVKNTYIEILAN